MPAQSSFFTTGNEDWQAAGDDPTSQEPDWIAMGGNLDGYIRVTDAHVGGLWYFKTAPKFSGNKCDAYGKYIRYDIFISHVSDTAQFASAKDVRLVGANGLKFYYDYPVLPNLNWKHYDILLKEDAGWKIDGTGQPPTLAQFQSVLGNLLEILILGEYKTGFDYGGLDNFILESFFQIDLDGDDSTTEFGSWNFVADTTCSTKIAVADVDVSVSGETVFDEMTVEILPNFPDTGFEFLKIENLPPTILASGDGTSKIILKNLGSAKTTDFELALRQIFYENTAPNPTAGGRKIKFSGNVSCSSAATGATAFLYLATAPAAGEDREISICEGSQPLDLNQFLSGEAIENGRWQPDFVGSPVFDYRKNQVGKFQFVTVGEVGCGSDTAVFDLKFFPKFELGTGDTVLCRDSILVLRPDFSNFENWFWQDGSTTPVRQIEASENVVLTASASDCVFLDSAKIEVQTCFDCKIFAPNILKLDGDGRNEEFRIWANCEVADFELQIFDRWGNLVFQTEKMEEVWRGFFREKAVASGVFVWRAKFKTEVLGGVKMVEKWGDLGVLR